MLHRTDRWQFQTNRASFSSKWIWILQLGMQKIDQKGRFFLPSRAKQNARLEQDKHHVIRFQEMHNRPLPIVQREGIY